jgi:hypothetical protein
MDPIDRNAGSPVAEGDPAIRAKIGLTFKPSGVTQLPVRRLCAPSSVQYS